MLRVQYTKNRQQVVRTDDDSEGVRVELAAGDRLVDEFRKNEQWLKESGVEWSVHSTDRVKSGDARIVDIVTDEPVVLFERKAAEDFIQSKFHGQRWSIQRDNMLETGARCIVVFENVEQTPLLDITQADLVLMDNIHVCKTASPYETFRFIAQCAMQLAAGKKLVHTRGALVDRKRDELVEERQLAYALSEVTGCTLDAGMAIQSKYRTMAGLVKAWERTGSAEKARKLLAGLEYIVLPEATAAPVTRVTKKKVIGPAVARRLYDRFCGPDLFA
jgi:ERCC4-type nuclease